jgi:hypothetical protein
MNTQLEAPLEAKQLTAKDLLDLLLTLSSEELNNPLVVVVEDFVISGRIAKFETVNTNLYWDDSDFIQTKVKSTEELKAEGYEKSDIEKHDLAVPANSFTLFV